MKRLIFLPVPESFKKQFEKSGEGFVINPKIPIPVEIPQDKKEEAITNLSMDMIIYGMLRAIEENQVKKEWIDYYCGFVLYLRPDILEICQNETLIRKSEG